MTLFAIGKIDSKASNNGQVQLGETKKVITIKDIFFCFSTAKYYMLLLFKPKPAKNGIY